MRAESPLLGSSVRRRSHGRPALVKAAVGAVALAVIAVSVGLAFAGSERELAPGTRIAGVDVGGLSEQEAVAKLESGFRRVASKPVTFRAGRNSFAYAADQLGVEPNWHAAVSAATGAGDGFGPIRGFRRLQRRVFGADVQPPLAVSNSALAFALDTIARGVDESPKSAALVRHGLKIRLDRERLGRSLARSSSAEIVVRTLGSLDRPAAATVLPVATVEPPVTATMLQPVARRSRIAVSAPVELRGGGLDFLLSRARLASLLALPSDGETSLAVAGPTADRFFRRLAQVVGRPPVNAHFAVAGTSISVVPARPGLELDVPLTARAILRAASSPTNRVAHLAVARTLPTRTTAEVLAMGIDRRMSTYKTYNAGTADRITNLRLGVEALDGTLVRPGATFSLNRAIGERTAARGFRPAPVILGTEYGEEIGGGTSQVATTTFNAAWEAGLRITERNPHALYISRYPLGRDATVYWPTLDLKFENDTKHWILVEGFAEPDGIRVSIYGGESRRVVSSPGTMRVTGPIPVKRVKDPSLARGKTVVESEGQPPSTTSVTRTVYAESGRLLRKETWNTSYEAEPTVVLVGPKAPPKEKGKPPSAKVKTKAASGATGQGAPTTTPRP